MPNARDDKDRLQRNKKKRNTASVFTPSEEIGEMHFSTENYSTALEYFHQALESPDLSDYPDRCRLYLRMADCHAHKGEYRDAKVLVERAKGLLVDPMPAEALGRIEYLEAYLLYAQGVYDESLKLGFSAYRRLKQSTDHRTVAYIQRLLGNCYVRIGLTSEAEDFFMDALSSFRRIEDRSGIAIVYNNLGLVHKNACRWNRALASLSKSLELAKSLGYTQHLIRVQLNLGVVYAKLRRFTDALSAFANAAKMAERFGDRDKLTKTILMQGRTFVQTGEYCKAEKYILRGQAMANEYGYGREMALADEFLGELMLARGKPTEALANLNKGLRKARKIAPEGDLTAEILRRIADTHLLLNDIDSALASVREGLEIAALCGENYEVGYFYRTRAMCEKRRRSSAAAAESLKTSVETFGKYGNEFEKHASERLLGRLYMRGGDQEALLRSKRFLSESIVGFGTLEESREQMVSQVLLAVVEERLGNLDDALLAIYEADRLAEEEQDSRYQRLLSTLRGRVESKMTRDTRRVLEQIPVFGDLQSGSRSREKLLSGLNQSLKLIIDKLNAQSGFVAIPRARGKSLEIVCRQEMTAKDAKAILAWHSSREEQGGRGLVIIDAERQADLDDLERNVDGGVGRLVCQELGFEGDDLGVIVVQQRQGTPTAPISQEALHFVGAYGRLVSLSVYELLRNERRREPKRKPQGTGFESIVTENNEMIKLLNLAERVAHSNATVLLQGETGTGKGLIAYAIHLLSDRRDKRFVHINCAAMPESLLESELFGHVKGAFTGAHSDKDGLLHQAHGGTIFLDEIGKTTLSMQGKLLQFLDSGKVRKVGSNELIPVDVRVICATKSDLMNLCEEGRFLEDFFYRINDFPLTIPPLRKRREDVVLLFFHYLRKFSREMGKQISDVTEQAMGLLKAFHWPGNVRELEKAVKRAVILADDQESVDVRHLPPEIASGKSNGRSEGRSVTLRDRIERLEREEIRGALERCSWNKSRAASELGISYPSLLSKIKRYNLRSY